MFAKISLTAAFFLMVAPSMAFTSSRAVAGSSPITHRAPLGMVLAQDAQPAMGTSNNDNDSDNDSDSDDTAADNQNAESAQTDQNAVGDNQPIPPTVLGQPEGEQLEPRQDPMNSYQQQPVNPYQ